MAIIMRDEPDETWSEPSVSGFTAVIAMLLMALVAVQIFLFVHSSRGDVVAAEQGSRVAVNPPRQIAQRPLARPVLAASSSIQPLEARAQFGAVFLPSSSRASRPRNCSIR